MKIYNREGNPISIGTVIGQGGEAVVYRVIDYPGWLAKIYEPAPRPNYSAKLTWMLEHPPVNPTQALDHPSLAWPVGLLFGQGNRLAGYLMPYIPHAVPVLVVFNPRRRAETLAQFDRRYLHRAARNLAAAVSALHTSGYVVGDLNESNVLVTSSALVTLIDTDSFQVQEPRGNRLVTYACPVAKPEYTPPELQGKSLSDVIRSPEQDAFSLGILIFQLLMQGNHPFRAQWLGKGDPPPLEERIALGGFPYTSTPSMPVRPPKFAPDLNLLHPEISELVRRCFIDGYQEPSLRPEASAWERTIAEAEKALVQCPNRHFFSDHLQSCPICHLSSTPARNSTWSTYKSRRTTPPSRTAGSNVPAGQPSVTPGTKASAATSAGKSASPPASTPIRQTQTSRSTASSTTARPTNTSTRSSPSPTAGASQTQANASSASVASKYTGGAATPRARPASNPKPQPPSGHTTSSSGPAGQASSGNPATGPAGTATGSFQTGGVANGFRQARTVWETYKFWQAQQAQGQQTKSGFGMWGSRQAHQAKAIWNTWKFWQAQQAQKRRVQTQQSPQTPSQTAQPTQPSSARPAAAQSPQGNSGATQGSNFTPPPSGAANTQQSQQASAQVAKPQPPLSRPAAQPAQPKPPATGASQGAAPFSQSPKPAPTSTSPQTSRVGYSQRAAPSQLANGFLNWAGPRLYKSLAIGGGLGALSGALTGTLLSVVGWSAGGTATWGLLWSSGGAIAGLVRGWQPSYRFSLRIDQAVGWQRVWPAFGLVTGAAWGGFLGFMLGWWAIFPAFLGLLLGGWLGLKAGQKLWQAGARLGWERIWAGVGAFCAALLGWRLATWLGADSHSFQLAGTFAAWITSQTTSLVLGSLAVGALGGALGGAAAGTLADLFARLLNLLD